MPVASATANENKVMAVDLKLAYERTALCLV